MSIESNKTIEQTMAKIINPIILVLIRSPDDTEKRIIEVLDTKIRPAVARDGGDIKFKSFENGIVKVELQGSCSGCPSSLMTLKQGVQNLLKHYVKEVNSVEAI